MHVLIVSPTVAASKRLEHAVRLAAGQNADVDVCIETVALTRLRIISFDLVFAIFSPAGINVCRAALDAGCMHVVLVGAEEDVPTVLDKGMQWLSSPVQPASVAAIVERAR